MVWCRDNIVKILWAVIFAFGVMAVLMFAVTIAPAQEPKPAPPPPSSYVAITIDEKTYQGLVDYLKQQPYMFSAPLMGYFEGAERTAIQAQNSAKAKAAEAEKKPEEKKKD